MPNILKRFLQEVLLLVLDMVLIIFFLKRTPFYFQAYQPTALFHILGAHECKQNIQFLMSVDL